MTQTGDIERPLSQSAPEISIVVSVRNEEENVRPLVQEFDEVLKEWSRTFEVIVVDDGSNDGTVERLTELKSQYAFLRCFRMRKGQSKSAGLAVGFQKARGRWIVTFDGDLQNDPSDVPALVDLARPGALICGVRPKRADTMWKRRGSKIANWVRRKILEDDAQDTGCGVKVFPRESIQDIPWIRGVHRFFAAVLKERGYEIINVSVNDRPRTGGETKYGNWDRLKRTVPDLFGFRWWLSRRLGLDADEF